LSSIKTVYRYLPNLLHEAKAKLDEPIDCQQWPSEYTGMGRLDETSGPPIASQNIYTIVIILHKYKKHQKSWEDPKLILKNQNITSKYFQIRNL
jgi:hypothetical protein